MQKYQSAVRPYGRNPGTRLWASGFRVSSSAARIIRNMPPTIVEFTCGEREPDKEKEMRKRVAASDAIAPVIDGEVKLKQTTSFNNLQFFTDKADAKAHYRDCVKCAMENVNEAITLLDCMKSRIDCIQRSYVREDA